MCPFVNIQIGVTHRLNRHGWVPVVITMHYVTCDAKQGKNVRTPLPSLLMLTHTEFRCAVVYFCNTFKTLLIKYFEINIVIFAVTVSQDIHVFTRHGVKEVWPDVIGLPCAIHIGRKVDDG